MNITGIALSLSEGSKIAGVVSATCTAANDKLALDLPLAGLDLKSLAGTVKVAISTGIPGVPQSGWAWSIGTPGGGKEFAVVLPPASDLDGDGDVDSADLGFLLTEISQGGTNGGAIGVLLSQFGDATQTLAAIGLSADGAGNGTPKALVAGGTVTQYAGDKALFRIDLPVVAAQAGSVLVVTVDLNLG